MHQKAADIRTLSLCAFCLPTLVWPAICVEFHSWLEFPFCSCFARSRSLPVYTLGTIVVIGRMFCDPNSYCGELLERDKGIEPSPPPWQGGVLPLYESREPKGETNFTYSMCSKAGQEPQRRQSCLRLAMLKCRSERRARRDAVGGYANELISILPWNIALNILSTI